MKSVLAVLNERTNEEISDMIFKNAVCSLKHGLDHYNRDDCHETNHKYAIIHVAHSLELVLKSILASKDRLLIMKDYERRDDETVNTKEACKRLRLNCSIELESSYVKQIKLIRDYRNRIEHFTLEQDSVGTEFRRNLGAAISLWCGLVRRYLSCYDLMEHLGSTRYWTVIEELDTEHRYMIEAVEVRIRSEWDKVKTGEMNTLPLEYCLCCGQKMVLADLTRSSTMCFYCEAPYDIGTCQSCGETAVLRGGLPENPFCERCSGVSEEDWKT